MAARTLFGARTPTDEGNGAKETRPRTKLTQENRPQAFVNPKAPKYAKGSLSNAKFTKMANPFAKPL